MSHIKTLFQHSSHYFLGRSLAMTASLISFPFYTRILSVSSYGYWSLISTTVALSAMFCKLGLQHSVVRFYPNYVSDEKGNSIDHLYSTTLLSVMAAGIFGSVALFVIAKTASNVLTIIDKEAVGYFSFAAILVFFSSFIQTSFEFLRAEQKTRLFNFLIVAFRYCSFLLAVFFCLYVSKGVYGLLSGFILNQAAFFLVFLFIIFKARKIAFTYYSRSILTDSLRYGLPLLFAELTHNLLSFGDRYLIEYYLGSNQLGLYSAAYGFTMYVAETLTLPLETAIIPVYINIWTRSGESETKLFLSKAFRYYTLVAIPSVIGFMLVSKELLALLASNRYVDGHCVVPYVLIGYVLYGTYSFFASGLILHKKTSLLSAMLAASCIVNILLNVVLIPKYGLIGAALATLIAYGLYAFLIVIWSVKNFMFKIPYKSICLYTGISLIMGMVMRLINLESLVASVACKILVGVGVYFTLIMICDREVGRRFWRLVAPSSERV